MTQKLLDHIRNYVAVSDSDFGKFSHLFRSMTVSKKQHVLKAGDVCDNIYFVAQGCLNMYFVTEKGVNQTAQFAIENWWISDFLAFTKGERAEFSIEAVEDSQVLCLSKSDLDKVATIFPRFETYLRTIYQIAYGASMIRLKSLYGYSKAEMYKRFVEKYPDFARRVPQYLLASFLGLTPEYVSELRARMRS